MTNVQMVPIDKIRILNARSRNKIKFSDIVENIATVGLKKPITVNQRPGEDGYDLVCGQGRLEAFIAGGAKKIPAIVVNLPLEEQLLRSLVENLTRRVPADIELARHLTTLKGRGHSHSEIAALIGLGETAVFNLIRLVENGEDRLLAAVERGDIPISVAIEISASDDETMQRSLQEAYDSGELRGKSLLKVRRILEERRTRGKNLGGIGTRRSRTPSTNDLVRTLRKETEKQELLVRKSRHCEQQLRFISTAIKELLQNEKYIALLKSEKLDALPKYLSEWIQK